MEREMTMEWFVIFVMIIFVVKEMERRRAPVAPMPKLKRPSVLQSPRLALIGAAAGVIGFLIVIGRFAG
jgi:hypothetical protein